MADGLEKRSGSGFFGSFSRLSLGGSSTPARKESSGAPAYDPSVDTLRPEDDVGETEKSEEVRCSVRAGRARRWGRRQAAAAVAAGMDAKSSALTPLTFCLRLARGPPPRAGHR